MDDKEFKEYAVEKLDAINEGVLELLSRNGFDEVDELPDVIPEGYFDCFERKAYMFTTTEFKVYGCLRRFVDRIHCSIFPKLRLNYFYAKNNSDESKKRKQHMFRTVDFVIVNKITTKAKAFITFEEDIIDLVEKDSQKSEYQKKWRHENNKLLKSLLGDELIVITKEDLIFEKNEFEFTKSGQFKLKNFAAEFSSEKMTTEEILAYTQDGWAYAVQEQSRLYIENEMLKQELAKLKETD